MRMGDHRPLYATWMTPTFTRAAVFLKPVVTLAAGHGDVASPNPVDRLVPDSLAKRILPRDLYPPSSDLALDPYSNERDHHVDLTCYSA